MGDRKTDVPDTEAGAPAPEPLCRICAQSIPPGALKCTKCDSYQNWLGRFQISTTTLSLLVALLATSISAIAPLRALFTPDDSDISVQFLQSEAGGFTVVAINGGTRPGFLSGGLIDQGTTQAVGMDLPGPQLELIRPGEVKQVNFLLRNASRGDAIISPGATRCGGFVRILNFRSREEARVPISLDCAHIRTALADTQALEAVSTPDERNDQQANTANAQ